MWLLNYLYFLFREVHTQKRINHNFDNNDKKRSHTMPLKWFTKRKKHSHGYFVAAKNLALLSFLHRLKNTIILIFVSFDKHAPDISLLLLMVNDSSLIWHQMSRSHIGTIFMQATVAFCLSRPWWCRDRRSRSTEWFEHIQQQWRWYHRSLQISNIITKAVKNTRWKLMLPSK